MTLTRCAQIFFLCLLSWFPRMSGLAGDCISSFYIYTFFLLWCGLFLYPVLQALHVAPVRETPLESTTTGL